VAWLTSGLGNGLVMALMLWWRGSADFWHWPDLGLVAGIVGCGKRAWLG